MNDLKELHIPQDNGSPGCACPGQSGAADDAARPPKPYSAKRSLAVGIAALVLWVAAYRQLEPLADAITYNLLGFDRNEAFARALAFFLYDGPKVLLLLTLVVFGVGVLRSFFTARRARKLLAGRREAVGNVLAALLGVVTPFCSCSAVPLFVGFVTAGVPLGVTFSFLVSAPMINEVALVMLYGLMGWKVAALYLVTGLLVAMVSGWVIGRLKMEGHLEEWVRLIHAGQDLPERALAWPDRIRAGLTAVTDIVGRTWPWVLAGIAAGAGIHGYVPEGFMASLMGRDAWWSVIAAVGIGIPMYSNAAGIIPVVHALLGKGAALGTVLAFMMSVIALSLPEMIILRKVLKPRLLGAFVGVTGLGILLVGYLFNMFL